VLVCAELATETSRQHLQELGGLSSRRCLQGEAKLEAAPRRPVEELTVIRRAHHDDVGRKSVDLQQQSGDHPLNLACLVGVRAFLCDGVELVEEKHTASRTGELEDLVEPTRCLAEETGDDPFIPDDVERHHRLCGDRLGQTCLAVARWTLQQNPISGFDAVTSQQLRALVFLDHLGRCQRHLMRELKVAETPSRNDLVHEVGHRSRRLVAGQQVGRTNGRNELCEPVGDEVMLVAAFLGDDRLDEDTEPCAVPALLGLDEVDHQI
jgi:hypothetical protein